jgi:mRNA interferase HigB
MHIIARGTILYYTAQYPKAKLPLLEWYYEFSKLRVSHFNELKTIYGNISIVANNRIIFNIKGNDYRLIVSVNFLKAAAYVIWFGTHEAYNKIDAATIGFDPKILNYKTKCS